MVKGPQPFVLFPYGVFAYGLEVRFLRHRCRETLFPFGAFACHILLDLDRPTVYPRGF